MWRETEAAAGPKWTTGLSVCAGAANRESQSSIGSNPSIHPIYVIVVTVVEVVVPVRDTHTHLLPDVKRSYRPTEWERDAFA